MLLHFHISLQKYLTHRVETTRWVSAVSCGIWIIYEPSKFRELPAPLLLFLFTEPDITKQLNHQSMRFGRPYSDICVSWFYVHEGYGNEYGYGVPRFQKLKNMYHSEFKYFFFSFSIISQKSARNLKKSSTSYVETTTVLSVTP